MEAFTILVVTSCLLGVFQVCRGTGSKYGSPCNSDWDCLSSVDDSAHAGCVDPFTACFERSFDFDTLTGSKLCPLPINTTRDVPQPACVGVPDAVQNVQVDVKRAPDNSNLTLNVSWTSSPRYVGPVLYLVYAFGDDHAPKSPFLVSNGLADEDTSYALIDHLPGNLNYTVSVTAITALGQNFSHAPVRITDTRPYFPGNVKVVSPYQNKSTSFDIQLCSSCLTDPNQGLVEAVAIVVCATRKSVKCQPSYVDPDSQSSDIRITQADDIKLLPTWAFAKSRNFDVPYRASPDDFHRMLKEERSPEIVFTVGGAFCVESDVQSFCNGPPPQESEFIITVIVCNDIGCGESHFKHGQLTTPDASDDDTATITGLAVAFSIALLICVAMAVYIVLTKRSVIS